MIDRVHHKSTIVRPQWIQMFLVGKRKSASHFKAEAIELTPLQEGQNLHLNLAASSSSSPSDKQQQQQQQQSLFEDGESGHQLQLVCQVGGSLPEAKIEWYRHSFDASSKTISNISEEIKPNIGSQTGRVPLISDSKFETRSLIRASESNSIGQTTSTIATTSTSSFGLLPIQWSSVKVHNITFEDHQTEISCSASNGKFFSSSAKDGAEHISTDLSTSLRLNITHVPSIKLELDWSEAKVSESQTNSSLDLQIDHLEHDVIALRDGPSLNVPAISRKGYNVDPGNNNQDLTMTSSNNNAKLADGQRNNVIPILIGHNYTLVCGVIFANPKIHEPIEWYLRLGEGGEIDKENKFESLDKVNWLVRVVERISKQSGQDIIEKLIIQFSHDSPSEKEIQLKCKARNALGQAQSNTIKVATGQRPKCQKSNLKSIESVVNDDRSDSNNSGNNLTDKRNEPSIQCPVISDKSSSKYHWLLQFGSDNGRKKIIADNMPIGLTDLALSGLTKPNTPITDSTNNNLATPAKAISNTFEFFTSNRTIRLSALKLILSNNSLNNFIDENDNLAGLTITCFVVDKFGSNIHDSCAVSLLGGQRRSGKYEKIEIYCCIDDNRYENLTN